MIRIQHAELPDGLRAVASRKDTGELVIVVSTLLPAEAQRQAAAAAVRALQRRDRFRVLPLPVVAWAWIRRLAGHSRAPVAAMSVAAVTVAAVTSALLLGPRPDPARHAPLRTQASAPVKHRRRIKAAPVRAPKRARSTAGPSAIPAYAAPGGSSALTARIATTDPSPRPAPAPSPTAAIGRGAGASRAA